MKVGVILTAAVVVMALAAPAQADVRYAAADGSPSPACSPAPCDLQTAVESASSGDEVVVLPGTYVESNQLDVSASTQVHGQGDGATPVIVSTAPTGIAVTVPSARVGKLELVHFGSGDALVFDGGVAEQLVVRTTSTGFACHVRGGALRDSICWSPGAGGRAAGMSAVGSAEAATLRNVTAVATGAGGTAVHVEASTGGVAHVDGFNVIADGAGADIAAQTDNAAIANIEIDYSNFATRSLAGTNSFAPVPGVGHNQSDSPVFADAANGDFHEHPDSPTIERGTGAGGISDLDVDGEPRFQGHGLDIGADEYLLGPPLPDLNPPDTKILKAPKGRTKAHHAVFKFGTSEPAGGTLMCSVDGNAYRPCKSPKRVKVGGGRHVFRVFSIDAAGNVDPTPAERAWHVKRKHKKKKGGGHGGGHKPGGGRGNGGNGGGGHE